MRNLHRVSLLIAFLTLTVTAQVPPAQQDVYQLGTKTIHMPPPTDFVGTFNRFTRLCDRFLASTAVDVSVVEVHVPIAVVKDLEKNQDTSISFYSQVAIPAESRVRDLSAADFKAFITNFEKQFSTTFNANGPIFREAAEQLHKGLNKVDGSESGLKLNQSTNLGYFQREPNVFSGMVLQPIEVYGQRRLLLGGFSFLHLKDRMVYVNMYRAFSDEKDAAILRDTVTKWTAAILAANK